MSMSLTIQNIQKHPLVASIICSSTSWFIANQEAAEVATAWLKLFGAAITAISATFFLAKFLIKWYKTGNFTA